MAITLVLGDPYVVWSKYYFLIMTTPENNKLFAVSEEEKELFQEQYETNKLLKKFDAYITKQGSPEAKNKAKQREARAP